MSNTSVIVHCIKIW